MIKHIQYTIIFMWLLACNNENVNDCFKSSGSMVSQFVEVMPFDRIVAHEGIELILREGDTHEVMITAGENLINEVHASVVDNALILSNNNSCNIFHDYSPAKLYVTAPDITEIRSLTQFDVRSEGVLTYPQLRIVSEDFTTTGINSGNFYLTINSEALTVTFNNLSNAFISGTTEHLNIEFFGGNSRFEGGSCVAAQVRIFHRSSNDIIVYPTALLEGNLRSTGDLIALQEPPVVNVTAHYQGKLIFREE